MASSRRSDPHIKDDEDTSKTRPSPPNFPPVIPAIIISSTSFLFKTIGAQKHRGIDSAYFQKLKTQAKNSAEAARTCHLTFKLEKRGQIQFFKCNHANSIMSELEAAAWAILNLVVPGFVPKKTNVYRDSEGDIVGVCSQEIPNFKSFRYDRLTEEDLLNADLKKRMAIGTTASYWAQEEDYHIENGNKYGQRIDFDMTFWPLLGLFKDIDKLSYIYRPPSADRYRITPEDILHFPDLQGKGSKPWYWPTTQPEALKVGSSALPSWAISRNAFSEEQNEIIKKLKNDPVFIYNKFKTLLKFMIMSDHNYKAVIKQHIRKGLRHPDPLLSQKNLVDIFTDHVIARKNEVREVLVKMEAFQDFMTEYGKQVWQEIKAEINQQNVSLREREFHKSKKNPLRPIKYLLNHLIDNKELKLNYKQVFAEMKIEACKAAASPAL